MGSMMVQFFDGDLEVVHKIDIRPVSMGVLCEWFRNGEQLHYVSLALDSDNR